MHNCKLFQGFAPFCLDCIHCMQHSKVFTIIFMHFVQKIIGCSCTQNCEKKQYLFPQLGGGITQPHVIQNTIILIHSSHNHKQWTRQMSCSMMASLLRPFYIVTNSTDVAPVLGRETDLRK